MSAVADAPAHPRKSARSTTTTSRASWSSKATHVSQPRVVERVQSSAGSVPPRKRLSRKRSRRKDENFWQEIGKYAATLAGSGTDEPQSDAKFEKALLLVAENENDPDETGTERLQRALKDVIEIRDARIPSDNVHGMEQDVLMRVALEDEFQLMSCASLPFTIIYFVIFMLFFQQHYNTVQMFLAEASMRTEVGDYALELTEPMEIFDWLEDRALPYLWGAKRANGGFSTDTLSLYQEVIAGLHFTTTRAVTRPCTYKVADHTDCHSFIPDSKEGDAFGYEPNSRLRRLNAAWSRYATGNQQAARPSPPTLDKSNVLAELSSWAPDPGSSLLAWHGWKSRGLRGRIGRSRGDGLKPNASIRIGQRLAGHRTFRERLAMRVRQQRAAERVRRRLRESTADMRPALPTGANMELSEVTLPVSLTFAEVLRELQRWRDGKVIDLTTVTFAVDFLVLNEHISSSFQTLSRVDIVFSFSRGGMMFAEVKIVTLALGASFDGVVSVFAGPLWLITLVAFTLTLPNRVTEKFKEGWKTYLPHFFRFWNILEFVITLGGWVIVMMFVVERTQNNVLQRSMLQYKAERVETSPEQWQRLDKDAYTDLSDKAARAVFTSMWTLVTVANYHLILIFRFFMASRGQPRLAVVLSTIQKASTDLIHLFIVFLIIILAYVFSGHLLFGRRMQEYATIEGSFADVIQIVTEREFNWEKFTAEDIYTATVWVWSFLVLVVLVVVNIFLAMIFESYADVRAVVGESATFWKTTQRFLTQVKSSMWAGASEGKWVPNKELVSAMRKMKCVEITPWMLKDAFPTISNRQVNHIFILAKKRAELMASRGRRPRLPEVLASIMLSIEKLHIGVNIMSGLHRPAATGARADTKAEAGADTKTATGAKPPSDPRAIPDGKAPSFAEAASSDTKPSASPPQPFAVGPVAGTPAPATPPQWVRVQLQPHFRKQRAMLALVRRQADQMDTEMQATLAGLGLAHCSPPPDLGDRGLDALASTPRSPTSLTGEPVAHTFSLPPCLVPAAVRSGLTQEGLADESFPPAACIAPALPSASRKPFPTEGTVDRSTLAFVELRSGQRKKHFPGRGITDCCSCTA